MAATVTVTVTGTLVDGAGAVITSANVKALRVDPQSLVGSTIATDPNASAVSNSSTGIFSLSLTGYDLMPTTHKITFPDGQYMYLRVPANAKSTGLGKIQCGTTPAKSVRDITPQVMPGLKFIGQDLASATALPEPTCDIHTVTGTTTVTSITATNFPVGKELLLIFSGILTLTDGNNIKTAGNYTTSSDDSIKMVFDGSSYFEIARSGAV
jgi:hypothetical protein